jgi:hypothetical protein
LPREAGCEAPQIGRVALACNWCLRKGGSVFIARLPTLGV